MASTVMITRLTLKLCDLNNGLAVNIATLDGFVVR